MSFLKYPSLTNHYQSKEIDYFLVRYGDVINDCEWHISEKIHGCLHKDTIIKTREFGEVTIDFLVKNQIKCNVLSLNHDLNIIEWDEIVDFSSIQDQNKEWFEIELDDGTILVVTGNHEIFTKASEYKKVEDLSCDDILLKR